LGAVGLHDAWPDRFERSHQFLKRLPLHPAPDLIDGGIAGPGVGELGVAPGSFDQAIDIAGSRVEESAVGGGGDAGIGFGEEAEGDDAEGGDGVLDGKIGVEGVDEEHVGLNGCGSLTEFQIGVEVAGHDEGIEGGETAEHGEGGDLVEVIIGFYISVGDNGVVAGTAASGGAGVIATILNADYGEGGGKGGGGFAFETPGDGVVGDVADLLFRDAEGAEAGGATGRLVGGAASADEDETDDEDLRRWGIEVHEESP